MTVQRQENNVSAGGGRGIGLTFLLALGGGLYGYGQNEWVGAGIGVIVGASVGFLIGLFIIALILGFVAWAAKD